MRKLVILLAVLTLTVPLLFYGCSGDDGAAGTSAPTTGTISGTVTDNSTSVLQPNPGVSVWWTQNQGGASVPAQTTTTDASGNYSLTNVPIGGVYVYMSKPFYLSPGGMFVGVGGGTTTQVNALMSETKSGAPSITVAAQAADNSYKFGATVTVAASVNYYGLTDPNDNVSTLTYKWENSTSPKKTSTGVEYGKVVGGTGPAANTAQVTFPTLAVAFSPRPAATQPGSDVSGYKIPNQFGVIPIFPDTRGTVTVKLTLTDPRGQSFSPPNLGLNAESIVANTRNVAQNTRIYLNGGDNASYNWTGTGPGGAVVFDNAASRTPSFRTSAGKYTVSVNGKSMDIFAGSYSGGLFANPTIKKGDLATNGTPADLLNDGTATDPANTNCSCHYNNLLNQPISGDKLNAWVTTRHAKIFTLNITTNIDPPGEGRTCIVCHSVGYDEGVPGGNGGFAQKMYAFDNLFFPYTVGDFGYVGNQPTFWQGLFDNATRKPMAQMANIQCENCHGPNGSSILSTPHGSAKTLSAFNNPRISFSAEVCAQCHGRTSHNFYSQWATLPASGAGHSNRQLAIDEGLPSTSSSSSSCARCHAAQGFTVFVDHLASGNFGNITNAELAGVTADTVEPITCTACHDPHNVVYLKNPDGTPKINPDTGRQETNNQLRVYNNTGLLPAGYRVTGFGKGALCVTCHNTRNGAQVVAGVTSKTNTYLHEDGTPASNGGSFNSGNPTSFSAPHAAAQGDVVAGRNAWFMGTGNLPILSRHAAIEEVCVNCHMANNPTLKSETVKIDEFGDPIYKRTSKSHTFRIDNAKGLTTFCSNCHGEGSVNGEAIQSGVENGLELIADKMVASLSAKLAATSSAAKIFMTIYPTDNNGNILLNASGGEVVSDNAAFVYDNTNVATAISVVEPHGQIGFLVTLTSPVTMTIKGASYTFSKFEVQLGQIFDSLPPAGAPPAPDTYTVYKLDGNMVRAGWNYFLIEGDASKGIHNPTFVQQVLNATLKQDLSN